MRNITFINAGAGSGKTFYLTQLLARKVNEGLLPEQVMLTTYTKKAAGEIRDRAMAALFKSGKPENAIYLQDAPIGTVHSVAFRYIRRFWYLLGISPQTSEMGDEDTEFYFSQAISFVPNDEELKELTELCNRFDFRSMEGDFKSADPEKWKKHILGLIDSARANNITDLSPGSRSFIETGLFRQQLFPGNGAGYADIDFKVIKEYCLNISGTANLKTEDINKLRNSETSWSQCADLSAIIDKLIKKNSNDTNLSAWALSLSEFYKTPSFIRDVDRYNALIFDLAARCIEHYRAFKKDNSLVDFSDMENLFLRLLELEEVRNYIAGSVKVLMVDEFQDSNPMQLAIFSQLSDIVEKTYWVGDPKQAIYGFRGSSPELIADLLRFFETGAGNNLDTALLKMSWRSRPGLVNFCNDLFAPMLSHQLFTVNLNKEQVNGDEKTPEYANWKNELFGTSDTATLQPAQTVPLIPKRSDASEGFSPQENPLIHWHFHSGTGTKGNAAEFQQFIALQVKNRIENGIRIWDTELEQLRSAHYGDVAILCKTNKCVADFAKFFKNLNIPVAAESSKLVSTAEFRFLVNCLALVANKDNDLAVAELLLLTGEPGKESVEALLEERLKFVRDLKAAHGNSPEYYQQLSTWGRDAGVILKLKELHDNSRHLSLPHLVEKVIVQTDMARLCAAWGDATGRRANLQQFIALAHSYDDRCVKLKLSAGIYGFIRFLDDRKDDLQQAGSNNPNAVKVLTYHKAKGLEWPIVVLFDLQKQDKDKTVLIKEHFAMKTLHNSADFAPENPLNGRYIRFAFWPMGDKENLVGHEETLLTTPEFAATKAKYLKEQQRLMYVGFTRARDYMVTNSFNTKLDGAEISINRCMAIHEPGFSLGKNAKENAGKEEAVLFAEPHLHKLSFFNDPVNEEEIDNLPTVEQEVFFTAKQGPQTDFRPYYRNPSAEEGTKLCKVEIVKDFGARLQLNTGMLNGDNAEQRLGNAFHGIFALNEAHEEDIDEILRRFGLNGVTTAQQLLNCVFSFENYLKEELNALSVYKEWPLEMKDEDGSVLTGSADLVVETPEGLLLIDYKSYPGGKDEVLNAGKDKFAGRYAGQLNAYARMLEATFAGKKVVKKLIYYTVLGVVVELTDA